MKVKITSGKFGELLRVKVPKGFSPHVFELVGDILYIYCQKTPKLKQVKFKL